MKIQTRDKRSEDERPSLDNVAGLHRKNKVSREAFLLGEQATVPSPSSCILGRSLRNTLSCQK